MRRFCRIAAALACLSGPAAAQEKPMSMDMGANHGAADKAFAASMSRMMTSMDVKPTGHPDTDFVQMMIPHHQGAIDMAKVELQYGKDPMLRTLAAAIVKAQDEEIAAMKAWLAKHGQ